VAALADDLFHPFDRDTPGGDGLSISIAAASIIARTMRDALMRNLHHDYPYTAFAEQVGYTTAGYRRRSRFRSANGARSGSARKKTDPASKKVSKGLSSNIL
jgi:ribonuclease HII